MKKEISVQPGDRDPGLLGQDWHCEGASATKYPIGNGETVGSAISYATKDSNGYILDNRTSTPLRGCHYYTRGTCMLSPNRLPCNVSSAVSEADFIARLTFLRSLPRS